METYTPEGVRNLMDELQKEIATADYWTRCNQGWDMGFKIFVCLLPVANSVFCAIIAKLLVGNPAPSWMPISTAAITTIIAVITTFLTRADSLLSRSGGRYPTRADLLDFGRELADDLPDFVSARFTTYRTEPSPVSPQ